MQVLEDELGDAKLQCSKTNATASAQKSNYEIAVRVQKELTIDNIQLKSLFSI